jgi:hypothetical protein
LRLISLEAYDAGPITGVQKLGQNDENEPGRSVAMEIDQGKVKALAKPTTVKLFSAVLAAFLVAGASTVSVSQPPPPQGPDQVSSGVVAAIPRGDAGPRVGAAGAMIGFSHSDGSGTQTITIVHAEKSWMAVYHIDRSGKIRLVSSRPIDADFSLQLNATSPLPEEIREIGRR